jgi:hypothetical protein
MLESPPLELSGLECWTADLPEKFIAEQVVKYKRILTARRRADMKDWLLHPNRISQDPDPAVRQKFANDKAWTNKNFELQSGQIYRRTEQINGRQIKPRYTACYIIIVSYAELAKIHAVHRYSNVKETLLLQPFTGLAVLYGPV